jgi:hypothetical protein
LWYGTGKQKVSVFYIKGNKLNCSGFDPNQSNIDNLNNVRSEAVRYVRKHPHPKKKERRGISES